LLASQRADTMIRRRSTALGCLVALSTFTAQLTAALEFDMLFQTKCVMEEINKGVLVVGDFAAFSKDNSADMVDMDVKVEDPLGHPLFEKRGGSSGQFAFTTKEDGDFKACFTAKDVNTAQRTKIRLDWKTGVAATDWDAIAKKDNLNEMSTELRRLEAMVKEIHDEMLFLRTREEEMRDLNEATNARVAWFSIGSLLICVVLAAWQLYYLKQFFHKKKLL